MSTQNSSQGASTSCGSTTPIDEAWNEFAKERCDLVNQLPTPLLDLVKYTFYVGALTSYNLLITAMRKDPSLRTMSMVSDQVVNDLNNTFEAMLTSKTH